MKGIATILGGAEGKRMKAGERIKNTNIMGYFSQRVQQKRTVNTYHRKMQTNATFANSSKEKTHSQRP